MTNCLSTFMLPLRIKTLAVRALLFNIFTEMQLSCSRDSTLNEVSLKNTLNLERTPRPMQAHTHTHKGTVPAHP